MSAFPPCSILALAGNPAKAQEIDLPSFPGWRINLYSSPSDVEVSGLVLGQEDSRWLAAQWMAYQAGNLKGTPTHLVVLEGEKGHSYALCVQILNFRAGSNIRRPHSGFSWRRLLSRYLHFRVLVLGQLLHSGHCGFSLPPEEIKGNWPVLLDQLVDTLRKRLSCQAMLLKDLVRTGSAADVYWQSAGYYALPADPSMELRIRAHWASLDDYLLDLSSKYRVRYRRARKQAADIKQRLFRPAEVYNRSRQLDDLFAEVRDTADFDPVDPPAGYFAALQEKWGKACRINGYFLGDRLVGFTTALMDGDTQHAHYLGFEPELNLTHHLYHNMLFDLIETAIESGVERLNFARTALEIKSSVGAEAVNYAVLLRTGSRLGNWLVSRFTPRLFPATTWQARHPFRGG